MDNITLRWQGPFTLVPSGDLPDIYHAAEAKTSGIYLWALPFEQAYLINYVGIAAESVAARQEDHMRLYLSGKYTVYKPQEFSGANRVVTFDPLTGLSAFLSRHAELSAAVIGHTKCVHLFFAPLAIEKVLLERIESSIIEALRNAGGRPADFLDNFRISRWVPPAQRISVSVEPHPVFVGLPGELYV